MSISGETEETIHALQRIERSMWVHPLKLDEYVTRGLIKIESDGLELTDTGKQFIENWGTTDKSSN